MLIAKHYCRPRDSVRLSMTCKRLYDLFDRVPYPNCKTTERLLLTCGLPYSEIITCRIDTLHLLSKAEERAKRGKSRYGGLCPISGWSHQGFKCPVGKPASCYDCKRKGPQALVLNHYAFATRCRMCETRITASEHGCAACSKLCGRCRINSCTYCNTYCYRFGHRCPTMKRCCMCGDWCDRPSRDSSATTPLCSDACYNCWFVLTAPE